jgi:bifunctional non-homologous end joining protein LigD
MTLEKYREKRDFKQTPEPAGNEGVEGKGGIFVVQKHAARQLHYDFRLEMEGVLKSWAVPKGPSLDPASKRLAVQVEDHAIEYAGFEGTIPPEEFGGGTVMVWDRGFWEPLGEWAEGFGRGAIKFTLHGEKLHGLWVLVRMKGRPGRGQGSDNWLLIKEHDAEARTGRDGEIVELMPDSVLTGRTLEEIAAGE